MELFMDNLRMAFRRGKHTERNMKSSRETTWLVSRVALAAALAFLSGRGAVLWDLEACSAGLVAALLARGKGNIYTVPLMAAGMLVSCGVSLDVWKAFLPVVACGVVFFALSRKKITLPYRAWITAGILTGAKLIYYSQQDMLFLYGPLEIVADIILVLVFVYGYTHFFQMVDRGFETPRPQGEGTIIVTAVVMLAVAGIGGEGLWALSPTHVAGLFLAIAAGHRLGILQGAAAGLTAGILIMAVTGASPALAGVSGFAGAAAGFFKGQNRILTGVCFAAVCMAFGAMRGYPELYFALYEPVAASLIFILLPESVLGRLESLIPRLRKEEARGELTVKGKVRSTLAGYLEVFRELALTYGRPADSTPARDLMTCQFKGMTRALETMMDDLARPPRPLIEKKLRYKVTTGVSRYARERNLSGDTCLCTGFRDDQYLIALSDGMGKGERAAEESALTIGTLHNLMKAGFDVEPALQIVNSILLMRSEEEMFSTVDLGLFSLATGRLRLFKIGAAATFIKRGEEVRVIQVSALPVGIIRKIPVDYTDVRVRSGDDVIIVSDGITEAAGEDENGLEWLREVIGRIRSRDPQTLADLILRQAIQRWGLREKDDMTVVAARVS